MNRITARLPALPIVIGWIAGILLWVCGAGWWLALSAVILWIALIFLRHHYIAFLCLSMAGGWLISEANKPAAAPESIFDGTPRVYTGTVLKSSLRPESHTLVIRIDSVTVNGLPQAVTPFRIKTSMLPDWSMRAGERIAFTTEIEPPRAFSHFPHDHSQTFNYLRDGIAGEAFIEDADIKTLGRENSLGIWFEKRREAVIEILARSDLSSEAFGLIASITVGYDDQLAPTMRENFQAAGIAHILALSGFHVGIIVIIVTIALFPLRAFYRLRKLRLTLALLIVWFYAAMVGLPPSVVRATIMLSIIILAKIFGIESNPLNSLCAAVAIILALSPFSLFSAGLQLSVAAVLGIIALAEPLNPFNPLRRNVYRTAMLFTVPVAAVIGTLPITVAWFHRIPLLFLLTNIGVAALMPMLITGGILLILLGMAGAGAGWLCGVLDFLTDIIAGIAERVSNLPFSEASGLYLSDIQIGALIFIVALLMLFANFPKHHLWYLCAGGLCVLVFIVSPDRHPAQECFIVSESGNTSIILRTKNRADVIFTCAPDRYENASKRLERRLAQYFEACGADSVIVHPGDFNTEGIERKGRLLHVNCKTVGLATMPGKLDSVAPRVDYAIIGSRFRGSGSDVVDAFNPDTIILGNDMSLKRANAVSKEVNRPVINLRHRKFTF